MFAPRDKAMASGEIVLSISKAEEQTYASTWILLARRGIIDTFAWETHLYLGSLMHARRVQRSRFNFKRNHAALRKIGEI